MAILESATLEIPLQGGLAEKVDPRVLPPGSYAVLENLVQDKAGAFKKRYGFGTVSAAHTGGIVANPSNLFVYQDEPIAIADDGLTPEIYQHDGGNFWRSRGRAEFGRVEFRREVARPTGTLFFEKLHRLSSTPRQLLAAIWLESDSNLDTPDANAKMYYRVLDVETGIEVVARTQVNSSTNSAFASCSFGTTKVLIAQMNATSSAYVIRSLDVTTGVMSSVVTITASGLGPAIDIIPYDATNFLVAFRDAGNCLVQIRNATTGVSGVSVTTAAPGTALVSVTLLAGTPKRIWVFPSTTSVASGYSLTSSGPTNLTVTTGLTALDSTLGTIVRSCPNSFDLAGFGQAAFLLLSGVGLANEKYTTHMLVVDNACVVSHNEPFPWSQMTTKPVIVADRFWATVAMHAQLVTSGSVTYDVATTCLVSFEVGEEFVNVRLCAILGRLRSTLDSLVNIAQCTALPSVLTAATFECPSKVFAGIGNNLRFGIDWTHVNVNQYAAGAHQNADCNGALAISGSHTAWLDGTGVCEVGFINDPQVLAVTQTGGGSVAAGDYDIYACYEYTDQAGNLHRSAPSAPFRITVTLANTTLTVRVSTASLTAIVGIARRPILIHVFRTLAGPLPDVFRLTSQATAIRNNPSVASVLFNTTFSDAQVSALGLGFLYSVVEVPARTPPPSNAVLVHKGRTWLAVADELGRVAPSKPMRDGLAPEFADEFMLDLPQAAGPVTALAPLDDAVIAFTSTQVYAIGGEGPSAVLAQGGAFSVVRVQSEHGCDNAASVVATEDGAFFTSSRGICAITRDQSVVYAGAAVETTFADFPFVRSAFVDRARRRVLWLCRTNHAQVAAHTMFVYGLDTKVWTTWVLPTALVTGHTMVADAHWVSTLDQEFGRETSVMARDFAGDYVSATLETPWIRVGGLIGHQRTRAWALAADRPDVCVLNVEVFIDLNMTAAAETLTIDLGTLTRVEDAAHPRLNPPIAAQKHSAIKLRFRDTQAAGDTTSFGRGLDYASLGLDIAGKKGLAKTAAGNRS